MKSQEEAKCVTTENIYNFQIYLFSSIQLSISNTLHLRSARDIVDSDWIKTLFRRDNMIIEQYSFNTLTHAPTSDKRYRTTCPQDFLMMGFLIEESFPKPAVDFENEVQQLLLIRWRISAQLVHN